MANQREPENLEQMLSRISQAEDNNREHISLKDIVSEVGHRSFGPLLLIAGIITLLPIVGDIPGVPTLMAAFILLVAGQLLFGRRYFWLPKWLLKRDVSQHKMDKAMKWMRSPARFIDRLLKPRLTFLLEGGGVYAIAGACVLIALAMPAMEVVPFTANGAGLAITLFALALMARDGLLALLAFMATVGTLGPLFYSFIQ